MPSPPVPRAIEFFAGMGLVRQALEREPGTHAGQTWRTAFANDFDPLKHRLYEACFTGDSSVFQPGDVAALSAKALPPADLWTASFPCTDLSLAGRGLGIHAGQSGAVWSMLSLLEQLPLPDRPANLLFENVLGLLTSHKGTDLRALVQRVNTLGYGVDPMCVDARRFTPQSRPRLFLLCARIDLDATDLVNPNDLRADHPARPDRLLRVMRACDDLRWHARKLPGLPEHGPLLETIIEDVPDDSLRWWSEERTAYFRAQIHPGHLGALERAMSAEDITHATAFRRVRTIPDDTGAMRKRSIVEIRNDSIAGCLRTPKGGSAKQILVRAGQSELAVRHLTPLECARLQGISVLPDNFSDSELLFGLGDAVCVPAVRWVLDRIERPNQRTPSTAQEAAPMLFSCSRAPQASAHAASDRR